MKILFANRRDCLSHRGGDTIQMLKTKEYLEKNHNCDIQIILSPEEMKNYPEYNIVHIFNLQTIDETLAYVKQARIEGKKIALSTIYWDLSHSYYIIKIYSTLKSINIAKYFVKYKMWLFLVNNILKTFLNRIDKDSYLSKTYISNRKEVISNADILLPNSYEELAIISKEFNLDYNYLLSKTNVIPNAVDINQAKKIINVKEEMKINNYVLQVGRIEINKNQLGLLKALFNDNKIPIVFVGRESTTSYDKQYCKELRELAKLRGNVYFFEEVSQDELQIFYQNAKVHVLASFRESPGLVSLEAFRAGCNIVVSDKEFCPINYYKFDLIAEICNPYDFKSIKKAVICALKKEKSQKEKIFDYLKNYSYETAAFETYSAYEKIERRM